MSNLSKFKILTFIRYFAESLFFPFISLYLQSVGFKTSQIGMMIGLIPLAGLIVNPIYSHFCKSYKITKNTLLVMSLIEAGLVILLTLNNSFGYCLTLLILIAVISSSNFGLIDSLLTKVAIDNSRTFSSIRIFGSTAYMIGSFVALYIARWITYNGLFYIAAGLFAITSFLYFICSSPKEEETKKESGSFKEVISNRLFILYLVFYVLLIGSMQIGDDFFALYITSKGAPDVYYSNTMLGFIFVEIVTMAILSKFSDKIPKMKLFFIGGGVLVLRLVLQAMPFMNVYALIASQLLRGITWAIALFVSSSFVLKILGDKNATRGIMLIMMIQQIYTSLFKFAGGYIIEMIGYANFYLIILIIVVIAYVYYFWFYFNNKQILNQKF